MDIPSHALPSEGQAPQTPHMLLLTWVLVFEKVLWSPCYYDTILEHFEYTYMVIKDIPYKIIVQNNLNAITSNGWVDIQIEKWISSLKQMGKIVNDKLKQHLQKYR